MASTPEPGAARSERRQSTRRFSLLLAVGSAESTSWWLVATGSVVMVMTVFVVGPLLGEVAGEVLFLLGVVTFLAGLASVFHADLAEPRPGNAKVPVL